MNMKTKNFFYPPGGILLWILIFVELLTFGIALFSMFLLAQEKSGLFRASALQLNQTLATINTLLLLTSGFFMAETVRLLKKQQIHKARKFLFLTILLGTGFLIIKSIEYFLKIHHGITLTTNTFFSFYYLLTGFHFIHVLVGIFILTGIAWKIQKVSLQDTGAAAAFWHMCDLIWLILFPSLYILLTL